MLGFGDYREDGTASALKARDYKDATDLVYGVSAPRRLMPIECERLMDWEDQWTNVPDEKGKPASDSARYRAIGNGVVSACVEWIGLRLRARLEAR
jgi:site-specific DNA-cytosine methylase